VADAIRQKEYEDKLHVSMFKSIEKRVKFLEYSKVVNMYEGVSMIQKAMW
jgi:hypothetical protein